MKIVWEDTDIKPGQCVDYKNTKNELVMVIREKFVPGAPLRAQRFALLNLGTGQILTEFIEQQQMAVHLNENSYVPADDAMPLARKQS